MGKIISLFNAKKQQILLLLTFLSQHHYKYVIDYVGYDMVFIKLDKPITRDLKYQILEMFYTDILNTSFEISI